MGPPYHSRTQQDLSLGELSTKAMTVQVVVRHRHLTPLRHVDGERTDTTADVVRPERTVRFAVMNLQIVFSQSDKY